MVGATSLDWGMRPRSAPCRQLPPGGQTGCRTVERGVWAPTDYHPTEAGKGNVEAALPALQRPKTFIPSLATAEVGPAALTAPAGCGAGQLAGKGSRS